MKLIAITPPDFFPGEADAICRLLDGKFWRVHIRKPGSESMQVEQLLNAIPRHYHSRLSLHDHFSLALRIDIGGVHLNSRNPLVPEDWRGIVSRSCHSIEELAQCRCNTARRYDYLFVSPVFDSISKMGYHSAFNLEELRMSGIIDDRTVALGGVTLSRLPLLAGAGFNMAAMLGAAWDDMDFPNYQS